MINLPPLHSTKRLDAKLIPVVLKSWQIGQILESRAKTSSNAQGELQIQVGEHLLHAKTKTSILAGDNLTLQIAKLGTEPLLKIISLPVETDPVTLFLRQAIPQPQSIKTVFEQFIQLQPLLTDIEAPESVPVKKLMTQIEHLIQIPVKEQTITSKEIRQFLQQTGFTLENQILKQEIPVANVKLELLQIKQTIEQIIPAEQKLPIKITPETITTLLTSNKPSELARVIFIALPPEDKAVIMKYFSTSQLPDVSKLSEKLNFILHAIKKAPTQQAVQLKQWLQILPMLTELRYLIDQSINTIVNNQLQAIQAEADSAFMVFLNLLVAKNTDWIDLFNIKITKEASTDDEEKHWKVTIQFDMPELGKIEARLILSSQDLHTGIISESSTTLKLIQENLHLLESALSQAGFNVATLSCKQEKIQPFESNSHAHQPLLDDKA